jgi:hypothetical protein
MRYSKLPSKELNQATRDAKTAIEHGQEFLKAIPRLPKSKALKKLSTSAAKVVHKLERQAEKLERAREKNSARGARRARVESSSHADQ